MQAYARVVGLRRRIIVKVPLLTPTLSSHWVQVVTPVPIGLARPLIESLTSEVTVAGGEDITRVVPGDCLPVEEALRLAVRRIRDRDVETSWREAELGGQGPAEPYPGDPAWTGGTLLRDVKHADAAADPDTVFRAVSRIGGDRGWPSHMWAWQIRGWIDQAVGGVGLRRGRRDPEELRVGDALDFWRVEEVRPPGDDRPGLIRLRAEMRLPGEAWLEYRMTPTATGTRLHQRALFAPKGLFGRLYWWLMLPFHGAIFGPMVRRIAAGAEELDGITSSDARSAPPAVPAAQAPVPARREPPRRRAG
jgi:hypothetical protein